MKPKLLFFDVGGTLVNEERYFEAWAEWLGVPVNAFFAALGAAIDSRRDYREVFTYFRPGFDLAKEQRARAEAGLATGFLPSDLYPDTLPTLHWAKAHGYRIGFAGNHSRETEAFLRTLDIQADIIGSSESWGVSKPDLRFFQTIIDRSGLAADEIAYVGDRIDNDILPAQTLGIQAFFIARGPWGAIQALWPEAQDVRFTMTTLGELPGLLER